MIVQREKDIKNFKPKVYYTINAKTKGYNSDSDEITYSDVKDIAEYAIDSVKWAYCAGIMTGDENGNFNPKAGTTRAQAASVFMRLYK